MDSILVTTTPILNNIEIQRYIGPITANVVIGANFFSDFAASFTDLFGGNSESYESKLDILSVQVDKLMKSKASRMGANAIIDYKLQFNEISGKGKQMFMVTATGTACIVTMPKQEFVERNDNIPYSQIRRQYLLALYTKALHEHIRLSENSWKNILSLNIYELFPELTEEYFRLHTINDVDFYFQQYRDLFATKFEEFLCRVDKSIVSKAIYSYIDTNPELVVSLVKKFNLFDPKATFEMLGQGNISIGIDLLSAHKDFYTKDDLVIMKAISSHLNNLPNQGSIQKKLSGLFSKKEEEIYVCPNDHTNPKDTIYCQECGLNIKGLTIKQVEIIESFNGFCQALEVLIS